jgi:hypothetical protein
LGDVIPVTAFDAVLGTRRGSGRPDVRAPQLPRPQYVRAHPYIVDEAEAWEQIPSMIGFAGSQVPNPNQYFFSPPAGSYVELRMTEAELEAWDSEDVRMFRECVQGLELPLGVTTTAPTSSLEQVIRLPDGRHARVLPERETIPAELEDVNGNKQVFNFAVTSLGLMSAPRGEIYRSRWRDLPTPLQGGETLYRLPSRKQRKVLSRKLFETIKTIKDKDNDEEMLAMMEAAFATKTKVYCDVEGVLATSAKHRVRNSKGEHYALAPAALVEVSFYAADSSDEFGFFLHARDVLSPLPWESEVGGCPAFFS